MAQNTFEIKHAACIARSTCSNIPEAMKRQYSVTSVKTMRLPIAEVGRPEQAKSRCTLMSNENALKIWPIGFSHVDTEGI